MRAFVHWHVDGGMQTPGFQKLVKTLPFLEYDMEDGGDMEKCLTFHASVQLAALLSISAYEPNSFSHLRLHKRDERTWY